VKVRRLLSAMAVAVAVIVGLYTVHATSPSPSATKHIAVHRYSVTEILQFLVFNTGQVIVDHPDLDEHRPAERLSNHDAHNVIESVTRCVNHFDAAAVPALTTAFNAADPQRIDTAVQRFDHAAQHWMSGPHKQNAPCPEPPPPPNIGDHGGYQDPGGKGWWAVNGYGYLYYLLYGADFAGVGVTVALAAAINLVVAVALTVLVAATLVLVPVFITYQFEASPTDLDHQTALAKLAKALRS
jgi:hypothetical protein